MTTLGRLLTHRMIHRMIHAPALLVILLSCLSCAQDAYERRAYVINDHIESFYSHLKANRVAAAVHANERIEAMADEMAETIRRRAKTQGISQVEREFALMNTARETAAQNWIALGQYFAIKQQPDKARSSYQRVIDSYTNPAERRYREQAARAIADLNVLAPVSVESAHQPTDIRMTPVGSPTSP